LLIASNADFGVLPSVTYPNKFLWLAVDGIR
jgi:hypothetical protein